MDGCIDLLGEGAVFSTLHAKAVYEQVEMENIDLDNSAFTSQN